MTRTLAIDIEASPTTDEPRFDDASAWTPFAIAVSFRSAVEPMPETQVFVRRDGSEHAERKMLAAVANWIHDRWPVDVLLTYNGGEFSLDDDADGFDMPILAHRIDELLGGYEKALEGYVKEALDVPHRDLFQEAVAQQPEGEKYPSLDEALAERDLAKATPKLDGEDITGASMPAFGEKVLAGDGLSRQEHRVLREYASSDVVPLQPLSDRLRERHAAAEAREAPR